MNSVIFLLINENINACYLLWVNVPVGILLYNRFLLWLNVYVRVDSFHMYSNRVENGLHHLFALKLQMSYFSTLILLLN